MSETPKTTHQLCLAFTSPLSVAITGDAQYQAWLADATKTVNEPKMSPILAAYREAEEALVALIDARIRALVGGNRS